MNRIDIKKLKDIVKKYLNENKDAKLSDTLEITDDVINPLLNYYKHVYIPAIEKIIKTLKDDIKNNSSSEKIKEVLNNLIKVDVQ